MNYARGAALGSIFGFLFFYMLQSQLPNTDPLDICIFGATFMGCVVMILTSPPTISSSAFLPAFLLILHSIAFTSNSFTFWEDRMVPFLLVSSLAPFVRKGISASNPRLRYRILGFSVLFAVCVRLMSMSTVCREEQQPYCHVTFYTPLAQPPMLVLYLALPVAIALPYVLHSFLKVSRSHLGLAKIFLPGILMTSLVASAGYWLLEWLDSAGIVESEIAVVLRVVRTWIARSVFVLVLVGGGGLWWTIPLCLDIVETAPTRPGERRQVTVIGYANAFGSPYLLLWSGLFAIVYLTTLLTGQLIMGLMAVALLSHLEVVDSARDVRLFEALAATKPSAVLEPNRRSPPIAFADIVPLALLGIHAFYATGHQATIPSIQWKSAFMLTPTMSFSLSASTWKAAFMLTPTMSFSLSASTVFLNSIGTIFLAGLAVPLLALWNRSPLPSDKNKPKTRPDTQIQGEGVAAALCVMTYYACLLLGAAVSSAILRRHLMVWKVFAPRFMLAVAQLIAVDLGVLIGFGVGVQHIGGRVTRMFRMPVNAPQ
uniref:GPI ethanolamine phosphate transferase 2 C-terminal domain-containing protein n=1 Tax=Mycena chlorophos TaxID=658473 RepID=A0ABQ0MCJ1_MYCCL|nr:predicted protein [Mycena chlorophos]